MNRIPGYLMSMCIVSLLMLLCAACTFSGREPAALPTRPAEDEVVLKFYFSGDKKAAADEVWNAVSDYVKTKGLNVRFDVNYFPVSDYGHELLVMSAAGDTWDMNFDADWIAFKRMATKHAYMTLNELLPRYAPNLYKKYKQLGSLGSASVNGDIVGLPWTMKMNQRPYAQWRSDLTRKAGINPKPGSIRTIEDLDAFLHKLKKAYPNDNISRSIPIGIYELKHEWVEIDYGLGFYLNRPTIQILPVEQQPFFRESVKMAKRWYDDGILYRDAMLDKEDGAVLWRNGRLLYTNQSHEWIYANPGFANPAYKHEFSLLYPSNRSTNRTATANLVAINQNSRHADRVLRFLDMLETDRKLYDLVQYGILGETYELEGESAVYPKGMDTITSNYMEWGGQWAFWKPQFMRPTSTYAKDFWLKEAEFASQPNNMDSPLDGLFITRDNITDQLDRRDRLIEQYRGQLDFGMTSDPDRSVDEYIDKQKSQGLDAILTEVQKQVDAFLAKHK